MAGENDTIGVYQELLRRNAVPPEHQSTVDELVRRGVLKGNGDAFSDMPASRQREYKQAVDDYKPGFVDRVEDSMLLGGKDEIMAGMQAGFVDAPKSLFNGDKRSVGQMYDDRLRLERAKRDKMRREVGGVTGFVGDLTGGFMMGPPRAAMAAAAPVASGIWETGKQLAKAGAVWGGGHAFLDTDGSSKPDATMAEHAAERLSAVPGGAAEGAVGALVLGGAIHGGIAAKGAWDARRARRSQQNVATEAEMREAGVRNPAPFAVTDNPAVQMTANGVGKTVVGGPVRKAAAENINDLEGRLHETLTTPNFGKDAGALGHDIQTRLEESLDKHSIPRETVDRMTPQERQDISGVGFSERYEGKPPRVPPTEPKPVPEPTLRGVTDADVEAAMPPIERGETQAPRILRLDDVPVDEAVVKRAQDAKAAGDAAERYLQKLLPERERYGRLKAHSSEIANEIDLLERAMRLNMVDPKYGRTYPEWQAARERLLIGHNALVDEMNRLSERHATQIGVAEELVRRRDATEAEFRDHQRRNYEAAQKAEQERVEREAEHNYLLRVAEARRATRERLEMEAQAEYTAQRADPQRYSALEEQARAEARADTANRQAEADRKYYGDLNERRTRPSEFRTDLNRESYETQFHAGYSQAFDQAPRIQRSPLGGRGPSGVPQDAPVPPMPPKPVAEPVSNGLPTKDDLAWAHQALREAKKVEGLTGWVVRNGGIADAGGEVAHIAGGKRVKRGLVRGRGMTLDDAARKAWEEGFFQGERPDIRTFLDALDEDLNRGRRVVRIQDREVMENQKAAMDILVANERGAGELPLSGSAQPTAAAPGMPPPRPGTYRLTTSTEKLLDQFGREFRRGGLLRNYRDGHPFEPTATGGENTGKIDQDLMAMLRRRLGNEIADRIEYLSENRGRNLLVMGLQGIRDIRTAVRRARADGVREAKIKGEPMKVDDAMLTRLESALTEDMHTFLRNAGPEGVSASERFKDIDRAYGDFSENLRRPLAKIYGPGVDPAKAMDRLVEAAQKGNTELLGAFMRVMNEKGDPLAASSAILSHMTGGGKDIVAFVNAYKEIPSASKQLLFGDARTHGLQTELERFYRVAQRLMPFKKISEVPPGVDFAKIGHLGTVAAMFFHFWPALTMLGSARAAAGVLSSPRYLRWLTALPKAVPNGPGTPDAARHLARLAAIAQGDSKNGDKILEAARQMLMPDDKKTLH